MFHTTDDNEEARFQARRGARRYVLDVPFFINKDKVKNILKS